jgi:hypothetical protein
MNSTSHTIEHELTVARQQLLDLSMRNPLLNYRVRKARTIQIVDEIEREVYDSLVLHDRRMAFLPTREERSENMDRDADQDERPPDEQLILWQPPAHDAPTDARHTDRYLQTTYTAEALQKRLFYVYQQARSALEEQGYVIHYAALGFLDWFEADAPDTLRRAPLILVPVELSRAGVAKAFKLQWTGDDIITNLSLQARLADDGLELPGFDMPEDKGGIDDYFQCVQQMAATRPGWNLRSDVVLDFFSFTKFVLYRDLDPAAWPDGATPAEHPLIRQVIAGDLDPASDSSLDAAPRERPPHYVMDADPSQAAVVEAAVAGHDLVVEGPPGTGKSQTITNIIAELLNAGKSVLFVSEKMAALEVVKNRLDSIGLGDYCLELHSRKTRKKEVLKELERDLDAPTPSLADLEPSYQRLDQLRTSLNGYATALGEGCGAVQRSPAELFDVVEATRRHFVSSGIPRPVPAVHGSEKCSLDEYHACLLRLQDLADGYTLIQPLRDNAWNGTAPQGVMPSDEQDIAKSLGAGLEATRVLQAALSELEDCSGVAVVQSLSQVAPAVDAACLVAKRFPITEAQLENRAWDDPTKHVAPLLNELSHTQNRLKAAHSKFSDRAFEIDVAPLLEEYKQRSVSFLRFLSSRYRYLKREITMLYREAAPDDITQRLRDLETLSDCQALRESGPALDERGTLLFGSMWQGLDSDSVQLEAFSGWVTAFRTALRQRRLTPTAIERVCGDGPLDDVDETVARVAAAEHLTRDTLGQIIDRLHWNIESTFGAPLDTVSFEDLRRRLTMLLDNIPGLHAWAQYVARRTSCDTPLTEPILALLEDGAIPPSCVVPCFEGAFAEALLRGAFDARPALAQFVGKLFDETRTRFADLDRSLIAGRRQQVARQLFDFRPTLSAGASAGSEAGVLLGEFARKRGHLPIRKLMASAGGLVQRIKPCFMMSPLSIGQFLDPRTSRFDVVVFDEASQVRPEDALGALLRADQAIVMGDTRQLPPTSFFDHLVDADSDEDGSASVADVESILHQCKRSFSTCDLRWHYRSRHESLIAIPNQEFYDSKLCIYPSAYGSDPYLGLHFEQVTDSIYDRGRSGTNRIEARRIVDAAMEHYRCYPDQSLGIGTFNIKQQQAILEEIELHLRQQPDMEHHFGPDRDEPFFVKNLETIQGDERDVILISVGFGFDELGRLSRNFGPLNQDGGQRRLNVLITRARQRCVVFSNFRAADLDVNGTHAVGLRALKSFLEYAERRDLPGTTADTSLATQGVERTLCDFLRDQGHDVRENVGCSSYRVDVGVIDPVDSTRFLLGIELDNPRYHDTPTARERDRQRHDVLRHLGWKMQAMWRPDWYRNRNACESTVLGWIATARQRSEPVASHHLEPEIEFDPDVVEETSQDVALDTLAQPYTVCPRPTTVDADVELHECPLDQLAEVMVDLTAVEGPLPFDEAVRRIRSWWGLSRAGSRVRETIEKACAIGCAAEQLERDHEFFLWALPRRAPIVRRRGEDPSPRIELIAREEISEAVHMVLSFQHATVRDALIRQTARLFGLRVVTDAVRHRVGTVIDALVAFENLRVQPNGMIALPEP